MIFGRSNTTDGTRFTTGAVPPAELNSGVVVDCNSEAFLLGKRSRRGRRADHYSPLDLYAGRDLPVPGAPGLAYRLGGADLSSHVRRVMTTAFATLDENAMELRAEFALARNAVLIQAGEVRMGAALATT